MLGVFPKRGFWAKLFPPPKIELVVVAVVCPKTFLDPKALDVVDAGLQIAFPKNVEDDVVVGAPKEDDPPKIDEDD